jgi:hypothetical protein
LGNRPISVALGQSREAARDDLTVLAIDFGGDGPPARAVPLRAASSRCRRRDRKSDHRVRSGFRLAIRTWRLAFASDAARTAAARHVVDLDSAAGTAAHPPITNGGAFTASRNANTSAEKSGY